MRGVTLGSGGSGRSGDWGVVELGRWFGRSAGREEYLDRDAHLLGEQLVAVDVHCECQPARRKIDLPSAGHTFLDLDAHVHEQSTPSRHRLHQRTPLRNEDVLTQPHTLRRAFLQGPSARDGSAVS